MSHSLIPVLNIDILNITTQELLETFSEGVLFTPNIDHLVLLQNDHEFYRAYKNAEYVVNDSQVLFLLHKFTKQHFREKISGSDFFPKFCEHHRNNEKIKMFILGGFNGVPEKVRDILNTNSGREMVVDVYSPRLGFEQNTSECHDIVRRINTSGANTLIVGLGAPKQEKWINTYRKSMHNVKTFMAVGATLDFIAGIEKRAPVLMQKLGIEWIHRLIRNPRKLANRYLVRDPRFFYYFVLTKLKLYKNPFS